MLFARNSEFYYEFRLVDFKNYEIKNIIIITVNLKDLF